MLDPAMRSRLADALRVGTSIASGNPMSMSDMMGMAQRRQQNPMQPQQGQDPMMQPMGQQPAQAPIIPGQSTLAPSVTENPNFISMDRQRQMTGMIGR